MAKLAFFALVFTSIVAFSEVSAYRTTITTTTSEEDNGYYPVYDGLDNGSPFFDGLDNGSPFFDGLDKGVPDSSQKKQCRRGKIQGQQLNHCQMHLTQGTSFPISQQNLQKCCNQLKQVEEQCQCEAIQKVIQQARQQQQQQQQQGGRRGTPGRQQQQMEQMLRKAQMLPNQCKLEIQQCRIPNEV